MKPCNVYLVTLYVLTSPHRYLELFRVQSLQERAQILIQQRGHHTYPYRHTTHKETKKWSVTTQRIMYNRGGGLHEVGRSDEIAVTSASMRKAAKQARNPPILLCHSPAHPLTMSWFASDPRAWCQRAGAMKLRDKSRYSMSNSKRRLVCVDFSMVDALLCSV